LCRGGPPSRDVPQVATGELDHLADFAFEDGLGRREREALIARLAEQHREEADR
jgi:hypothetical protein